MRTSTAWWNLPAGSTVVTAATRPVTLKKLGDGAYRIAMAVAGFAENELDLTMQENTLVVTGAALPEAESDTRVFLHRGIAKRVFERRFQLADTIKVTGASYVNGLLHIDLVREIPEHKKPRKVAIGAAMAPAGPVGSRLAAE